LENLGIFKSSKKQLQNPSNTRKTAELLATQARWPGKMAGPGLGLRVEASFFLGFFVSFCAKTKRKFIKEPFYNSRRCKLPAKKQTTRSSKAFSHCFTLGCTQGYQNFTTTRF
jgi:hypothetical protein